MLFGFLANKKTHIRYGILRDDLKVSLTIHLRIEKRCDRNERALHLPHLKGRQPSLLQQGGDGCTIESLAVLLTAGIGCAYDIYVGSLVGRQGKLAPVSARKAAGKARCSRSTSPRAVNTPWEAG